MSKVICLIPARKGSKRLPGKNTADFHGRPLGAWTFDFALSCDAFDKVVLTTDDEKLEALAPDAVTRLPRPESIAGDNATLFQVIHHVIEDLPCAKDDILVLTPVTGPLRSKGDLDRALEKFEAHDRSRTVFTVCRNPYAPHLLFTMNEAGELETIFDRSEMGTRKQAFPTTYFWNDSYLIDSVENFLKPDRDLYGANPVGVDVPPERSAPIDHPFDLWLASQLFDPDSYLRD
ncbi:MAG: acylneuraminate cytidylyltransferase family protein [Pseudomonadota bacterium]